MEVGRISVIKFSDGSFKIENNNKRKSCKDWEIADVVDQWVFSNKEVKENVLMNIISLIVFFGLSVAGLFWIGSLLVKLILEVLK